ncbi:MAG: M23 family metallopeptidase [Actinomycetota bacterium]|nr:M23 family metallopeptidase [Actinomycetota bacterium]
MRYSRIVLALVLGGLLLVPSPAMGHQDYSLAPNGVSPFLYNQPFQLCGNWYGENTHADYYQGVHNNDHHAVDLCPTGGSFGKVLYPIWSNLRVYAVDRSIGKLDMRGTIGGRYHRLTYRHMNEIWVNPGQIVGTNTRVGTVGTRGFSSGPHLHLSVHVLGGDGWFYSRRPMICGREIPHDHYATFQSC